MNEMDRGAHFVIGLVVFFTYNFINTSIINSIINPIFGISAIGMWLIGAFAAAFGSVVPDQIEPADHWTHRSTFHSIRALNFTTYLFAITAFIGLFFSPFFYLACFFLGYMFHLLADSTTKVGLPG